MWFKVDDNLFFHQKVIAAGNSAMGLWVRAGAWSGCHLTDGFIPEDIARALGSKAEADKLCRSGLWAAWPGGYCFTNWDRWQRSKADLMEDRAEAKERMRKLREQGRSG